MAATATPTGRSRAVKEQKLPDRHRAELRRRHLRTVPQGHNRVTIGDAAVQGEARIIDTLEPVMKQHRLVVCSSVVEWDYSSNGQEDKRSTRLP